MLCKGPSAQGDRVQAGKGGHDEAHQWGEHWHQRMQDRVGGCMEMVGEGDNEIDTMINNKSIETISIILKIMRA